MYAVQIHCGYTGLKFRLILCLSLKLICHRFRYFCRNSSRKPCRSTSDDYDIICFHALAPPSYRLSLLVPTIIFEFPPDFVISDWFTPRSLAKISMVLGEQKPAWQRPIPALVRRLIPSNDFAPSGRLMASMISPSVIISQRQIMFPYSGFSLINAALSSLLNVFGFNTPLRVAMKSFFSSKCIFSFNRSATISPIAGLLVSPGDSIPAQSINPFASATSSIINS